VADWLVERHQDNLRLLDPVLAYHYSRAGLHQEGLRYAVAAADDARDIFANREAVELYKLAEGHLRALGVEERWQTAVNIYLSRGEALRFIGDFSTAVADVEQAISLSLAHRGWERAARAHNLMAELKCRQAHYDEAQVLVERVIVDWAERIPSDELARAYQWLGTAASSKLDHELALSSLKRAEMICHTTNNKKRLARVLEGVAYVYYVQRELGPALDAMQRSVNLSRGFNTPTAVVSALNNIGLIQSTLGLPEEALHTFTEAIELLQDASRNFLAHVLANRAAVLAYLGDFSSALDDFEEAISHFVSMDDEYGMLETHLLWGYEYCNVLGQWGEARYHFEQARRFIDQRPHSYPEEKVRFLLGYGQVELEYGETEKAESLLKTGEKLIEEMDFVWWRPVALYLRALLELSRENRDETIAYLLKALKTIDDGGCPDYQPLILLKLAQLEENREQRTVYLEQCVRAAQRRARYSDRIHCFRYAGELLVDCDDVFLRSLGEAYLIQARQWEANLESASTTTSEG
jgi:tetratricopeptide (TPR) repeat protein